jgi:uncharacterized protein (DUF58 family)
VHSPEAHALAGEVAGVAGRYRLQLRARRFRGRSGARRGHGVGSSQEFFDFRDYAPGDDLRHLDWRGYARTEQLRIRLHQEEVAPYLDVLVDTSASLASTPGKERAARLLVHALMQWARREAATVRLVELGGALLAPESLAFTRQETSPAAPEVPLRPSGVRILLTDGLWQGEPGPMLQRLFAGGCHVVCLQLLDPWELDPAAEGAITLLDCESADRLEVQLDARSIRAYRERLERVCDGLRTTILGNGGVYARVKADHLSAMCLRDLLPASVLEPA